MTGADLAIAFTGIALVVALAAGCTIALRLARVPGGAPAAAIVGGLLAGVFLGPSVLGRAAPEAHDSLIRGGSAERAALIDIQREHAADIAALRAIDASPVAISEQQRAHAQAEAPLIDELRLAQGRRFLLQTTVGFGGVLLWIILTAIANPVRLAARRSDARIALAGAMLALIITSLTVALLTRWLVGVPLDESIPFAIACAVTMWVFDYRALASDTLRRASAPTGWLIGGVLGLGAIALVTDSFEAVEIAIALTLLALWIRVRPERADHRWRRRRLTWRAAWTIAAPALVALTSVQLDFAALVRNPDFWIAFAIALILCHDGRWLGSALAHYLVGGPEDRAALWQRSGVVLDLGVGVMQCAVALLLLESGRISEPLIAALLVSAAAVELFQPIRQPIARWMDGSMRDATEAPED